MVFPPHLPLRVAPTGPPPSIQLERGAGPLSGGPGMPGRADSPQVTTLVNQAADLVQQALAQERDPEDKAMLADIVAKLHKFAGSQQKLVDQATGAGPGAKLIHKAT